MQGVLGSPLWTQPHEADSPPHCWLGPRLRAACQGTRLIAISLENCNHSTKGHSNQQPRQGVWQVAEDKQVIPQGQLGA